MLKSWSGKLLRLVILAVLVVSAIPAQTAQSKPQQSVTDDAAWAANFTANGVIGSEVNKIVVDGQKIYLTGSFTQVGGISASNIAMWDGTQWNNLGVSSFTQPINDILVAPNGNLYVTGYFTSIGGVNANSIAMWDGSQWSALGSGLTGVNNSGSALALYGSSLLVGGSFNSAGGVPVNSLALWDGKTWSGAPGNFPTNNNVTGITFWDGKIVVGTVSQIFTYENDTWNKIITSITGYMNTLVTDGVSLYAGGSFSKINGFSINTVARWDGTNWSAVGNGFNGLVDKLFVDSTGTLLAGGAFTASGTGAGTLNHIARLDGSTWQPLGLGANNEVRAIVTDSLGRLLVGGNFSGAGGILCNHLARYDGVEWQGVGGDGLANANEFVYAMTSDHQGGLFVGASGFSSIGLKMSFGGVAADYIARWDGSAWHALAGGGVNEAVYALAYDPAARILYAGGHFTQAGGGDAQHIARWNGSVWQPLGRGVDGDVNALAVDSAGNLVVGGKFATAGGLPVVNLACWIPDGSGDGKWDNIPIVTNGGYVRSAAFDHSDQVFVGGAAMYLTNTSVSRFANLLSCWGKSCRGTGRSDAPGPWVFSQGVRALAFDGTGALYAADSQHVARLTLDANGVANWSAVGSAFNPGGGNGIRALTLDRQGTLYASGWFDSAGGVSATSIASWTGSAWQPLGSGLSLANGRSTEVYALAVVNNSLYAGGQFDKAGGKTSLNIARYALPAEPANQPPVVSDWQSSGKFAQPLTLGASPFLRHYRDAENDPLASVRILSLPAQGELQLNGSAVPLNQPIAISQLNKLAFLPPSGWTGQTSFNYTASDGVDDAAQSALASLSIQPAETACTLSGQLISADLALSPDQCNPYIVQGNLVVQEGVTLTLAAGTTLRFDGPYSISVNGGLIARGSETQPITFTSNRPVPAPGDWGGISFAPTALDAVFDAAGNYQSGSVLQHALIEYAGSTPVDVYIGSSAVLINAAAPYLDHNEIRYSAGSGIYGFALTENEYLRATGNRVDWNARYGIYLEQAGSTSGYTAKSRYALSANQAFSNGFAGIYVDARWVSLVENTSAYNGTDGIWVFAVENHATDAASFIHANRSYNNDGAGIFIYGMLHEISSNLILNNRGVDAGGLEILDCITNWCSYSPVVTIRDNTITGNLRQAQSSGTGASSGGLTILGNGKVTVYGNLIKDNHALASALNGGGILFTLPTDWSLYSQSDRITIQQNQIDGNTATGSGAGIYLSTGAGAANCPTCIQITQNQIINNVAGGKGGAIAWSANGAVVSFSQNNMTGNQAAQGSAVYNSNSATSAVVQATNNYWGTTNQAQIESMIYHYVDDATLGIVNYVPFLSTPISIAPSLDAGYSQVRPGIRVNFSARMLAPASTYTLLVNGSPLGSVQSSADGQAFFTLVTSSQAQAGTYRVALQIAAGGVSRTNSASATVISCEIKLNNNAPVTAQAEDLGTAFTLPANIGPEQFLNMLPLVVKR